MADSPLPVGARVRLRSGRGLGTVEAAKLLDFGDEKEWQFQVRRDAGFFSFWYSIEELEAVDAPAAPVQGGAVEVPEARAERK